jgi:hypothetical protein
MLAAATFLTNDPVKISCYLSLPLPYVSATIWNLDRNIHWMTEGYGRSGSAMHSLGSTEES